MTAGQLVISLVRAFIGVAYAVVSLICYFDWRRRRFESAGERIAWLVAAVLGFFLGQVLYFILLYDKPLNGDVCQDESSPAPPRGTKDADN